MIYLVATPLIGIWLQLATQHCCVTSSKVTMFEVGDKVTMFGW